MSGLQRHQCVGLALPAGYVLRGYQILETLLVNDYSVTYLVSLNAEHRSHAQEASHKRLLVEYFPCALARREAGGPVILPRSELFLEQYRTGRNAFVDLTHSFQGISHPFIAGVLCGFNDNNTAYRLVEYKPGVTLEQFAQGKELDEQQLKAGLARLLDGLQAIYDAGQIHGQLNPASILVQQDGKSPLITFPDRVGVQSGLRAKAEATSMPVSPGFSACEQYYTKTDPGPWTDIYAMGCLLYQLISKVTPVSSISRLMSVAEQQRDPLVTLSSLVYKDRLFSRQFLNAIDHAMSIEAADRPQNLAQWREELGIANVITEHAADERSHTSHLADEVDEEVSFLASETEEITADEQLEITTNIDRLGKARALVIPGVSTPQQSLSDTLSRPEADIDFHAISQLSDNMHAQRSGIRQYWPYAVSAILLVIIISSGFMLFSGDPADIDIEATDENSSLANTLDTPSVRQDLESTDLAGETLGAALDKSFLDKPSSDADIKPEQVAQDKVGDINVAVNQQMSQQSRRAIQSAELAEAMTDEKAAGIQHLSTPAMSEAVYSYYFDSFSENDSVTTLWTVTRWQRQHKDAEESDTRIVAGDALTSPLAESAGSNLPALGESDKAQRNKDYYLAKWAASHPGKTRSRVANSSRANRNQHRSPRRPTTKTRAQYQREWQQKQKLARQRQEWQKRQLQKKRQAQYREAQKTKLKVEQIEKTILEYSEN